MLSQGILCLKDWTFFEQRIVATESDRNDCSVLLYSSNFAACQLHCLKHKPAMIEEEKKSVPSHLYISQYT